MKRHEAFAARQKELFARAEKRGESPNPFSHASLARLIGRGTSWVSKFMDGQYQKLDHEVFLLLCDALDIEMD